MDVSALKASIKNKSLDKFYIFTGEEWYMQKLYMSQIAKTINAELSFVDDAKQMFSALNKKSFLSTKKVFVLRDDADILSNPDLIETLKHRLNENIAILVLSSIDKRTKLYKTYKDTFIEFNTLETAILKRHIERQTDLSEASILKLIDICENNYGRILLELDKIQQYRQVLEKSLQSTKETIDSDEVFEQLLTERVIYSPAYDAIFDFVDDILMHNVNGAYYTLDNCKRIGESTLAILSVLYKNAKAVLQVQSCQSSDIEQVTGLTYAQIKYARRRCNVYRIGDLVYMLQLIRDMEFKIKTGQIDESVVLDYILVNIL